jgi:hypothetical protein
VWRAPLAEKTLELTNDILSLKQATTGFESRLTVELVNDNAKFAALPARLISGAV